MRLASAVLPRSHIIECSFIMKNINTTHGEEYGRKKEKTGEEKKEGKLGGRGL